MSILNEFPEEDKWIDIKYSSSSYHSANYVDWLEDQVTELEEQRGRLRNELATARRSLEAIRQREVRRYKHEQDYLPYEERYE